LGTKYSSQAVSGFDSSPPVDDGTASEANKVKWSSIKNKLASPLKTHAEAINTALVTALDKSCRTVSANDAAAATDHDRTIQVTTSSVSITLADAATMAAGYTVSIANQSSGSITVALATATDTIDTVTNATVAIPAKEVRRYIINTSANGYITASDRRVPTYAQRVYAQSATRATSNTAIPADNSIPQNNEGEELITASITPKSSSNRIRVRFNGYFGNNTGGSSQLVVALFRDSTADAKKAVASTGASGDIETVTLEFEEAASAATATTYKVRFGPASASGSGWAANGGAAANLFGGVDYCTLILEEVA
jgi:hypothetical protein